LILLLGLKTIPTSLELASNGKPRRVYVIHMMTSVCLLLLGWFLLHSPWVMLTRWASVPLLLGVLVRCGTIPAHNWITDLFEHATLGTAVTTAVPLAGMYAAARIVVPVAPGWVLGSIGLFSLLTAVYTASMAAVQNEARRFFAYLYLSYASLVLVGLERLTPISLTGSLALWFSLILTMTGLGLTLRAIEGRYGRLSLNEYHGLYEKSPTLAVFFLLTGLASVGFPGTLGFLSAELLVDGVVESQVMVGVIAVVASALCGIAVVRAYLAIFTGTRHVSSIPLGITLRERVTVSVLGLLILGGGLWPQPGVTSRYDAAHELLTSRTNARVDQVHRAPAMWLERLATGHVAMAPPGAMVGVVVDNVGPKRVRP
jgi:NADH-quinone oxidoreductase subunit M